MNKLWKFLQYGYLIVAFIILLDLLINWEENKERMYIYIGVSLLLIFLFFFKRWFRLKIQKRSNQFKK